MSPRDGDSGGGGAAGGGADDGAGRVPCPAAAASAGGSGSNGSSFECLTGGQCVNATDVCNGVDDCDDASDESFTHAHCYGIPPSLPYSTVENERVPKIIINEQLHS